jgi:hypothetical protein
MGKAHSYTAEAFNDVTCTQLSSSSFSIEPNQRHRHVTSHRTQQIKSLSTKVHTYTNTNTQNTNTYTHTNIDTHTHKHIHSNTNTHTHRHTRTHISQFNGQY